MALTNNDQHIVSRKHRRFAEADENWTDLDRLLRRLERPLKHSDSDDELYL
jgi:regulatory subunit for Cdc7p protein kinase